MPFPVHSLTLKNAQFDISHFWTSACWYLLILLHIPRNVREPFRMDETLCLTAEDTKEQEWEGSIYKAYWKNEGKITNFSAIVISGTVTFFKSWVKGRILSWCEEYSLTSRVLLCVARLVSKEHLFLRMDLELCFSLLQEMYLYKLQNNFALLLVVIVHFVMQYINFSDNTYVKFKIDLPPRTCTYPFHFQG